MQGGQSQWRREQEIGSGAFGVVTLWKNQVTHEKLVIKQCKQKLDSKSHTNWLKEINLMNTMQHKNLVRGREIPKEIVRSMNNPEDLLGLEFCDNDLRKVLSDPSHCCGLKEKNVLNILRDVSCGMKFLHKDMHIIHRDLKPENILLCHRDKETVYKITDLGVAKRIDVSICMSFVGTLQYLAPELYDHESPYSYSADYWSFGTVMFECITGERPFLLTEKAFDWYKCIQGKKDEEIWGCYVENVGTKFLTELPTPNHLCSPALSAFKDWLQLVLRKNPDERGRNHNGDVECFTKAESILQLKVVHVFDMLSSTEIAYDYQPGQIGSNLKFFLEKELNFPKDDQLLIFAATGDILEDSYLLLHNDLQKDTIYLFSTNKHAKYTPNMKVTNKVYEMLESPDELYTSSRLKKAYAHALYFCKHAVYNYKCLFQGLRALMISMKSRNRSLQCFREELGRTSMKLETIIDVYVKSCNVDSNNLRHMGQVDAEILINDWAPMTKEIESFLKFTDIKARLKDIHFMQEKCSALQKSHFVGIQQSETELDHLVKQAEKLYSSVRGNEKEFPSKLHDTKNMCGVVNNCVSHTESLFKVFANHLIGVMKSYDEIGNLNSSIERDISNLKVKYNFIMERQLYRQGSLWRRPSLTESSSFPSLSSDSNLLSSLQGEIMDDTNEVTSDVSAESMINDMNNNFERLRMITKDEELANVDGSQVEVSHSISTVTPPSSSIIPTTRNNHIYSSLSFPAMSKTDQPSKYTTAETPTRERSFTTPEPRLPTPESYRTITNERTMSSDPRAITRMNNQLDRYNVNTGFRPSSVPEESFRRQGHIELSTYRRQPEHGVFPPTTSDQHRFMGDGYPSYYDPVSLQSSTNQSYYRQSDNFPGTPTSGYNNTIRPSQYRSQYNVRPSSSRTSMESNYQAPKTTSYFQDGRQLTSGRSFDSQPPLLSSYKLRVQEHNNNNNPRMSSYSPSSLFSESYRQSPPPQERRYDTQLQFPANFDVADVPHSAS